MKKIALLSTALTAAALSTASMAQSNETLEVQASKLSPVDAKITYQEFKGSYDMSDGSLFSFRKTANKYYAVIDAAAPAEIRYVGENRFVTASGRTEFRFALDQRLNAMVTIAKENGTVIASAASTVAAY